MPSEGTPSPEVSRTPIPALPLDYQPPARGPSRAPGRVALCLSSLAGGFMTVSYAMYRNMLGFDDRPVQVFIAWASIVVAGLSSLATVLALTRRRGPIELTALALCGGFWVAVWLLTHF